MGAFPEQLNSQKRCIAIFSNYTERLQCLKSSFIRLVFFLIDGMNQSLPTQSSLISSLIPMGEVTGLEPLEDQEFNNFLSNKEDIFKTGLHRKQARVK